MLKKVLEIIIIAILSACLIGCFPQTEKVTYTAKVVDKTFDAEFRFNQTDGWSSHNVRYKFILEDSSSKTFKCKVSVHDYGTYEKGDTYTYTKDQIISE